eukprot:CAMPEP_0119128638 /NCGR_PEP_ID=MMETSP1310-20130426/6711_1 /TAXON_ID=464262 /ORGANISM="Genus nov. species nov., Strain RCC2339" /LENGTH=296 /DNA_ID=CAMNT_0007118995 /DNA_START=190 /DNA_END=1077 /DNA_ORIENTATION=-
MVLRCNHCGSQDVEHDGNKAVCTVCASIVEDTSIVSEVQFHESSSGASSVGGVFVSGMSSRQPFSVPGMYEASETRQMTLQRGRRVLQQLANQLGLNTQHVDMAHRLFQLASQHNFVHGRKTATVCACCLYVVCRREKTPHMLLDFSDALQINVFVLGHTFLRLCRLLSLQNYRLPLVEPALFVRRFASKLEFGDKTAVVSSTALRIIAQMKRDWIQTGRQPAGICGAALLMAARRHGFRRTQKEIVDVVRVCTITVRKRMQEFGATPASLMSPEEFDENEMEGECNPPCFTANLR